MFHWFSVTSSLPCFDRWFDILNVFDMHVSTDSSISDVNGLTQRVDMFHFQLAKPECSNHKSFVACVYVPTMTISFLYAIISFGCELRQL